MKRLYYSLAVLGFLGPYIALWPWLVANGLDIPLLINDAMENPVGAMAWADVVVAAIALIVFVVVDGKRKGIKKLWLPIAGTFVAGVSLGLPLYLALRESHTS